MTRLPAATARAETPRAAITASGSAAHEAARAALFAAELHRRVDAMTRGISAGAVCTVVSEANALATGAAALSLPTLAADAGRIEHAARAGDSEALSSAFVTLQSGLHDTLAVLRRRG